MSHLTATRDLHR